MRPLSHQDTLVPWSCLSKNNAISAHSPTFFSVAFPPSCNMSLHGCWNVVDRKRGHANMHLIIPLRPRAMSRPGHALRLVEKTKKAYANSFIHMVIKLCDMKHIITFLILASQHRMPCFAYWFESWAQRSGCDCCATTWKLRRVKHSFLFFSTIDTLHKIMYMNLKYMNETIRETY